VGLSVSQARSVTRVSALLRKRVLCPTSNAVSAPFRGDGMVLSLARIFAYTRQLEVTLAREREEHVRELARVNAERAREREDRRAAERRASDTEKLLHERSSEVIYKLGSALRLPPSPIELAERQRALNQKRRGDEEKTVHHGVETLSQTRRRLEEESLRKARSDRENGKSTPQEERIAEEAMRFKESHAG